MFKMRVKLVLLVLLFPFLLSATHIIKNDLLKPEASKMIETMADELLSKTGINGYLVATNENFPEKFNLVEYSKKYESSISKPYVMLIFAPNATITKKSEQKGRVAIIASSKGLEILYDKSDILDATIDIIAVKDKNSIEDKYNIGIVQGFSELADQIASSKDIKMETTIPNDTKIIFRILETIVVIGAVLVFWIFFFKPLYMRIKNGKQ